MMRKTEKKSGKRAFVLLVIAIPILAYILSFSSLMHNAEFVEKGMGGRWEDEQYNAINSFVAYYLMDPDEERLIGLESFSEEEQQHLLDVKKVFHRAFDLLFLIVGMVLALAYFNNAAGKGESWRKILLYSGIITAAIPIILYLIPFGLLFSTVHSVFFAPGTWVFPKDAVLLQVYPIGFWKSAAFSLFLRGFVTGWLLILAGFIVGKRK